MSPWKLAKPKPDEQPGATLKTQITRLAVRTGVEIFGSKAINPDQKLIEIYVKRGTKEVRIANINQPADPMNIHPKSKAGEFLALYGKEPTVGMIVTVRVNADGFWELNL